MIWQNAITHNGYAQDAHTSQAITPASVGLSSGLSGTRRACPPPSRRKRRS